MKKYILLFLILSISVSLSAQKYFTKTAKVSFYSSAPLENIEATNNAVGILLNAESGDLNFSLLIKSFVFEKKLMQEHFNENYLESDKFPKAKFQGKITNLSEVNFTKDGKYTIEVSGDLSIHGETNRIKEPAVILIKNGKPSVGASFSVLLSDYKIKIPSAVRDKISKDVKIIISGSLKEL